MLNVGLETRTIVIPVWTSVATPNAPSLPEAPRLAKLFHRPTIGASAGLLNGNYAVPNEEHTRPRVFRSAPRRSDRC